VVQPWQTAHNVPLDITVLELVELQIKPLPALPAEQGDIVRQLVQVVLLHVYCALLAHLAMVLQHHVHTVLLDMVIFQLVLYVQFVVLANIALARLHLETFILEVLAAHPPHQLPLLAAAAYSQAGYIHVPLEHLVLLIRVNAGHALQALTK
jgi:hypothetical protein